LDYLYYADGEAWVVGATFGGPRVGIVNFERKRCPYQVTAGTWRHSVNGKLERDSGIALTCVDPAGVAGADTDVAETVIMPVFIDFNKSMRSISVPINGILILGKHDRCKYVC
jgi:hypothetical protein